jgi:hypothetical protein
MNLVRAVRSERGSATVFVVGAFLALLLVVGMSTDLGIFLRYRRAMMNACDSGVLAGGLNLRSSPLTAATTAERYATNDMRTNAISWTSFAATTYDANWNATLISPDRIRAVIQATVPTYFWRLVQPSVNVAVTCAARLTPIILTRGLVPLGVNYNAWSQHANTDGCLPVIQGGVPLEDREPPCNSFPITLQVSAASNPWGSGNTGMLSMPPGCFDCNQGASGWEETFVNGSANQYCLDAAHTAAVSDVVFNGEPCANVMTRPGTVTGPVRNAVDERCDDPNPLRRIIMMPLLNPAYTTSGNGRYTVEIWGFAAYELDCDNRPQPGAGQLRIRGGFVSFVSMQATGTEAPVDTGVYTIKLIE